MLPAANRLRRSADFQAAARYGIRVARANLVLHVLPGPADVSAGHTTRVGFTVGKGVGGSVTRHRVTRRMRAAMRERLSALPVGCTVVVRALPGAATASGARLDSELGSALAAAVSKLSR